ncbi:MAG: FlgD immunoglobulin-like domain containing protein, partial [Candidatus Glassbacteria bacterium]
LYQYVNSALVEIGTPVQEPNPPVAGDLIRIDRYRVGNDNLFDIYHNDVLTGTLVDPDGLFDPQVSYAGIVFENEVASRMPEIDNFTIGGATGNHAPSVFSLAWPIDGDTISGDVIDFMWHASIDEDPRSLVKYEFYLDVDSLFPGDPVAVDLVDTVYSFTGQLTIGTTYYWKVVAYDEFEERTRSQELFSAYFDNESGIDQDLPAGSGLPRVAALQQNYPNPLNPSTVIRYEVPVTGDGGSPGDVPVELNIYDGRGRLIRILKKGNDKPGRYSIVWDGRDERGSRVASGIYIFNTDR